MASGRDCKGMATGSFGCTRGQFFKTILLFCSIGLLISLIFMTYGIDLSSGLF